jgi:CheY-like chemotaxis protein
MSVTRLRILVVGGQAEDVRAVDAAVRDQGLSVDWIEPADAPAYLDAPDILAVVLDLDNTGLAVARVFRDPGPSRQIPLWFLTAADAPEKLRTRAYGFAVRLPGPTRGRRGDPGAGRAGTGLP